MDRPRPGRSDYGRAKYDVAWECFERRIVARFELPPVLIKTFAKSLLAIAACLYLSGSHLAFLQIVAWSGMLVSYSAESGLAAGMRDTFSGRKPCSMCKAISAAKKHEDSGREKAPVPPNASLKLWTEMLPAGDSFIVKRVPLDHLEIGQASLCLPIDAEGTRPPVPPPRPVV